MTEEEAIAACKSHAADVSALGAVLALSGISFAVVGREVEAALGLPKESLANALIAPQQQIIAALSAYGAVLENVAKGQLSPVVEEWSEVLDGD